jgi:non-lysosomal glucosylceramidase
MKPSRLINPNPLPRPIPPAAWTRRFDQEPPFRAKPIGFSLKLLLDMLPTIVRMLRAMRQERNQGRATTLDVARSQRMTPSYGVPLGGIGGGSIGRGWRGDFNRWQMHPGLVEYRRVPADQFSLRLKRAGQAPQAVVLNPTRPEDGSLSAWNWNMDAQCGTYHALFPRAWSVYQEPLPGIRLVCRQVSPVIPHNYRESSYPVAVFDWSVENTSAEPTELSLMFTFQNGTGGTHDCAGEHSNHLTQLDDPGGKVTAIELHHSLPAKFATAAQKRDPLTFAITAQGNERVSLSYQCRFQSSGDGAELWEAFLEHGRLPDTEDHRPVASGETLGAALAAQVSLAPGESCEIHFALAWDMPVARFGGGSAWYRRYTRFYGRDGNAAASIAADALANYANWEDQIEAWQSPVLEDPSLPDWYKSALFNESYYLVEGGTLWTAGRCEPVPGEPETLPEAEIGHFGYLESHEYRMVNTYDVHFTASFALAMLFPELELSLQRDFLSSLPVEQSEQVILWANGRQMARKAAGIIPHDLGSPTEDPWLKLNAYRYQDVSRWKDLNSKFVLQIYRDYLATGRLDFLADAYLPARQAIEALKQFDRDQDG